MYSEFLGNFGRGDILMQKYQEFQVNVGIGDTATLLADCPAQHVKLSVSFCQLFYIFQLFLLTCPGHFA